MLHHSKTQRAVKDASIIVLAGANLDSSATALQFRRSCQPSVKFRDQHVIDAFWAKISCMKIASICLTSLYMPTATLTRVQPR